MSLSEVLEKIKHLQEKAKSCADDREALDLQHELVSLLQEALSDKSMVEEMVRNSDKKF